MRRVDFIVIGRKSYFFIISNSRRDTYILHFSSCIFVARQLEEEDIAKNEKFQGRTHCKLANFVNTHNSFRARMIRQHCI